MSRQFFFNFSGRNLPDYSRKDFDSMLVIDGSIVKTGYQLASPGNEYEHIDLQGSIVFPAFADAHVHLTQTGITLCGLQLDAASCISELTAMIRDEAEKSEYVFGWGLQESRLKEQRLPTTAEIDRVCPDRFVWLARIDLHSAVLNRPAIKWARSIIPDLDIENGHLKGEAYNILSHELNNYLSQSFKTEGLQRAQKKFFSRGVATVHAMEGSQKNEADTVNTAAFLKKSALHGVVYHQSPDPVLPKRMGWARMGGCLLVDGSLGTRTAALHEEYSDMPGNCGNQYLSANDIEKILGVAGQNKMQLAMHAIGDRALDTVTACYAWSDSFFGKPALAHRIEHFILPSAKALKTARESRIMVCIQPAFDYFWGGSGRLYEQRLGKERLRFANPFKTMLDLGIQIAGGSDSPVTPVDPLLGIHALVNHSNPDERIDLNSALSLFISEPHRFSGEEKQRGHLRKSFLADFVCLADDPFSVSTAKIKAIEVTQLFIGGKKVY
jgi:predicted amidohydrolase YtcJ